MADAFELAFGGDRWDPVCGDVLEVDDAPDEGAGREVMDGGDGEGEGSMNGCDVWRSNS